MRGLRAAATIAAHDLRRSLSSGAAWAIHGAFLALHGGLFVLLLSVDEAVRGAVESGAFRDGASLLPAHAGNVGALLILFAPLLVGGALADAPGGAGVLVRGAPVRSGSVVVGKWGAAVVRLGALTAVAQLPVWLSPSVQAVGPRLGWLALVLALFVGAIAAVSAAASAVAGGRAAATVGAWALLLGLWTVGRGAESELLERVSLGVRYERMVQGEVVPSDLGLLVALALAGLGVAAWALEARRWR